MDEVNKRDKKALPNSIDNWTRGRCKVSGNLTNAEPIELTMIGDVDVKVGSWLVYPRFFSQIALDIEILTSSIGWGFADFRVYPSFLKKFSNNMRRFFVFLVAVYKWETLQFDKYSSSGI